MPTSKKKNRLDSLCLSTPGRNSKPLRTPTSEAFCKLPDVPSSYTPERARAKRRVIIDRYALAFDPFRGVEFCCLSTAANDLFTWVEVIDYETGQVLDACCLRNDRIVHVWPVGVAPTGAEIEEAIGSFTASLNDEERAPDGA